LEDIRDLFVRVPALAAFVVERHGIDGDKAGSLPYRNVLAMMSTHCLYGRTVLDRRVEVMSVLSLSQAVQHGIDSLRHGYSCCSSSDRNKKQHPTGFIVCGDFNLDAGMHDQAFDAFRRQGWDCIAPGLHPHGGIPSTMIGSKCNAMDGIWTHKPAKTGGISHAGNGFVRPFVAAGVVPRQGDGSIDIEWSKSTIEKMRGISDHFPIASCIRLELNEQLA